MRRALTVLLVAGLVAGAASCGSPDADEPTEPPDALEGVGRLPQPLSLEGAAAAVDETTTTATTIPRSTVARPDELTEVGDRVAGNRVIVIGDSITASTSRRYGGEMCFSLLPLGWAVEVNAEISRFIDFGNVVVDRRLRPDSGIEWDAAVVFLGSNYGGDVERYRAELHRVLDRLAPRPTVLVTVTEFRADRAEVNDVIRGMLDFYPELQILDWAEITRDDRSLLSGDGLHLSADGRARLSIEVAEALGPAPAVADPDVPDGDPIRPEGECLSTTFTDDSAGHQPGAVVPPAGTPGGGGSGGGSGGGGSGGTATTTTPPSTTRPAPPGGSATTVPRTVAPTTATTVAPTVPATTLAPPTTAAPPPTVATTTPEPPPPTTPPPTSPPEPEPNASTP